MGSCISTTHTLIPLKAAKKHRKSKSKSTRKQCRGGAGSGDARSKSPPPSLPFSDEETVKEVLSETPAIAKQPPTLPKLNETPFIKAAPLLTDEKHAEGTAKKPGAVVEVPEICNAHGGGGVGLAKIKDKIEKTKKKSNVNDNVSEVCKKSPVRLNSRTSAGEVKREKTLCRSAGRASESPADRSRPGSITSSGHGRRKDVGEISGRRSRSPVSRANGGSSKTDLGRSPSSRRMGKSPGRVGSGLGDRLRKVDEGKDKWPLTSNGMLENPVVSLECFIFL